MLKRLLMVAVVLMMGVSGSADWSRASARVGAQATTRLYMPFMARDACQLFVDRFDNANNWPTGDDSNETYEVINGEYRMLLKVPDYGSTSRPGIACTNYTVAVDARSIGNADTIYGLEFGISNDFSEFYLFNIAPDGYYYLFRSAGSSYVELTRGFSSAINTGSASNRLKVERNGALIRAFVNGQLVAQVSDGTFTGSRTMGVVTFSYNSPNVEVRYDNFVICGVGCDANPMLAGTAAPENGVTGSGGEHRAVPVLR